MAGGQLSLGPLSVFVRPIKRLGSAVWSPALRRKGARTEGTLENFQSGSTLRQRWPAKAGTPNGDSSTQLAAQLHGLGYRREGARKVVAFGRFRPARWCASPRRLKPGLHTLGGLTQMAPGSPFVRKRENSSIREAPVHLTRRDPESRVLELFVTGYNALQRLVTLTFYSGIVEPGGSNPFRRQFGQLRLIT